MKRKLFLGISILAAIISLYYSQIQKNFAIEAQAEAVKLRKEVEIIQEKAEEQIEVVELAKVKVAEARNELENCKNGRP